MNTKKMQEVRNICWMVMTSDFSINQIANTLSTSPKRVAKIKKRLHKAELSWDDVKKMGAMNSLKS